MAFNAAGFDGTVTEADFAAMMAGVGDHGILGTYNDSLFSATRVVAARQMLIQPGVVLAPGCAGTLTVATNSPAASANSSGVPRIDLVVARFDWSANTVVLATKEGTPAASPQPPALTQTPGTLFEVPLRQSRLNSGSAEYTTTDVAAGDRRYWLQSGVITLPSTTPYPVAKVGRVLQHPDTNELVMYSAAGAWQRWKAHSNTGAQLLFNAVSGFSGTTYGQIVNGWAIVQFFWTKGTASIADAEIDGFALPAAYRPTFDVVGNLITSSPAEAPQIYITRDTGAIRMRWVTLNAGGLLTGSVVYPVI